MCTPIAKTINILTHQNPRYVKQFDRNNRATSINYKTSRNVYPTAYIIALSFHNDHYIGMTRAFKHIYSLKDHFEKMVKISARARTCIRIIILIGSKVNSYFNWARYSLKENILLLFWWFERRRSRSENLIKHFIML